MIENYVSANITGEVNNKRRLTPNQRVFGNLSSHNKKVMRAKNFFHDISCTNSILIQSRT